MLKSEKEAVEDELIGNWTKDQKRHCPSSLR